MKQQDKNLLTDFSLRVLARDLIHRGILALGLSALLALATGAYADFQPRQEVASNFSVDIEQR